MHKTEFPLQNMTHKILWDFEVQTVHLNSAKISDLEIVNKRERKGEKLTNSGLYRLGNLQNEDQRKRNERQYLHLARELIKLWSMIVTVIPLVIGALRTIQKGLKSGVEEL